MGAVETAMGMGTGTGRKCRQKVQQLTQMDSSEREAVSFQIVGGGGAGGWDGAGQEEDSDLDWGPLEGL